MGRLFLLFVVSAAFAAGDGWRLVLWVDGGSLHRLVAGMDSAATDGFDPGVDVAIPPFNPTFFCYFACNDPRYSYIPALSADIRAPADSASWQIVLRNASVPVVIEWDEDSLPAGYFELDGNDLRDLGGEYEVPGNDTIVVLSFRRVPPAKPRDFVRISFELPRSGRVEVVVRDESGEVVARIRPGRLAEGKNSVRWNTSGVRAGRYFYSVLIGSDEVATGEVRVRGR